MNEPPKISIVTPSFNQGAYLAETLQSLVDQDYPNLEVIIQDGGSTDNSIEIAQRFADEHPSLFQLAIEEDDGQADALNRGFEKTTGTILGFLNSDDKLERGCLWSVAREIDPERGRHVVFGRCLFFGNDPGKEGRDHPSRFKSRFDQLAIWTRQVNQIPQPSTFWHRSVWDRVGGIDTTVAHAVDYDLFCRFSRYYRFHKVPEIWSRYRLHDASKTTNMNQWDIVDECIAVSRRHWGSWLWPLRWRCSLSYALYRRSERSEVIEFCRETERALLNGDRLTALLRSMGVAWSAPLLFRDRLLFPFFATRGWTELARAFQRDTPAEICPNSWVGPFYEQVLSIGPDARSLRIHIEAPERFRNSELRIVVLVDGHPLKPEVRADGVFAFQHSLEGTDPSRIRVTIHSSRYFVPSLDGESEDERLLSARLLSLEIIPATSD